MIDVCHQKGCSSQNRIRIKGDPDQLVGKWCNTCNKWLPIVTPDSVNYQRFEKWCRRIRNVGLLAILVSIIKIGHTHYTSSIPLPKKNLSLEEALLGAYVDRGRYRDVEIETIEKIRGDSIYFRYTELGKGNDHRHKLGWIDKNSRQAYFEKLGDGSITNNAPLTITSNNNEWELCKKKSQ